MTKERENDRSGMKPKKSLGQNFLKNKEKLKEIIEAGNLNKNDNVLEIGPGEGALTRKLIESAGRVLAVEKDEKLAQSMKEGLSVDNFEILGGDILEINLPSTLEERGFQKYKLLANIPYYITGKILRLFFETKYRPQLLVLLVQKEVAERICARPGKRSLLSTIINYFGEPEVVSYVSREDFYPVPEVDSAILKIIPYEKYEYKNKEREKNFFRLIKVGFSSPRKTLVNNLSAGFDLSKGKIEDRLKKAGLKEDARAQNLSVQEWQKLEELFFN
ncbi:MAG: 16S rRNA (adenine(1518)-N(6)/adenine(1519)-N(6))-dimethyltransferase RsmA [Candidatus Moraniibacteriota bacterium]